MFHATLLKFSFDILEDVFRDGREWLYLFRAVGFMNLKIHCSWKKCQFSLPRRCGDCGVAWRCDFTYELQCNFGELASLNATPTSKIVFLHAILIKLSLAISNDIFRDVWEELYLFRPVGLVKIHCSWENCQLFLESRTIFYVALGRRCVAMISPSGWYRYLFVIMLMIWPVRLAMQGLY